MFDPVMFDLSHSPDSPVNQEEDVRLDDCLSCGERFSDVDYNWQECSLCGYKVDHEYNKEEDF